MIDYIATRTLPVIIDDLDIPLRSIARRYMDARARSGDALLEAAAALAEARSQAAYGEWKVFLEATNTNHHAAERLLHIHARATTDSAFADAVLSQWLLPSVAARLARPSTPPEVITAALASPEPPTARGVGTMLKIARANVPTERPDLFDRAPEPLPARLVTFATLIGAVRAAVLAGAMNHGEAIELVDSQRSEAAELVESIDYFKGWLQKRAV